MRVIRALLLREVITRYGRHGLGMLWMMLEPMIFTLGIATLWYFIRDHLASDIPVIAFAITGYSSVLMWRNTANRTAKAIEPNLSLMYHRNVKVFDVFMSRIILEWVGSTASFAVLTILFASMGTMRWPSDLVSVLLGWCLLAWFSMGLAMIVGAVSERSETFERTWHVFTYLMFPLSGAAFMVDWLPAAAQKIILLFPMVHGVELIREGFFGHSVRTYGDVAYFSICNLVLMLIGLALTREAEKRVQPE